MKRILKVGVTAVWLALQGMAAQAADADLLTGSLDDLLATEVVGASKSRQPIAEAPANVTVISADEIRRYGYRTLTDALVRVAGVVAAHTPHGSALAVRGSSANQSTDWGARILLMIDGHRVNDGIYNQALFGYDSLVDIEAVERIEFIKGPGSTLYGGNALYGVVNVITRRGRAAEGVVLWSQATPGATAFGSTLGGVGGRGVEWRLSAARRANPTFTSTVGGQPLGERGTYSESVDYAERSEQASLTVDAGQYRLVALASRWRPDAGGQRRTDFDGEYYPARTDGENSQYLLGGSGRWALGSTTELAAQFSVGQSEREFLEAWEEVGHVPWLVRWRAASRWSGTELRLTTEAFARQRLSLGVEWRRDLWRDYADQYRVEGVALPPRRARSARDSVGVYLQDEIALAERWALTLGGRLDKVSDYASEFSPRLALIWAPTAATTVKLIHAEAFRPPNAFEYESTMSEGGLPIPQQRPELERVKSDELLLEYRQGGFSGSASLFANRNQGMITYLGWIPTVNQMQLKTHGVELSASARDVSGFGGYANLAWQKSRDAAGEQPAGTPAWVASAGVDVATADGRYQGALEWQAVARRQLVDKQEWACAYGVANLRLAARPWHKGLELSLQVLNLTDRSYLQPSQGALAYARGRTVWLGGRYTL
ncbi:TonB-dependent receptor [Aquitalea sp. S1-19]|nr:TonB-dependent receptor [Aquitalea sp. S1-19]